MSPQAAPARRLDGRSVKQARLPTTHHAKRRFHCKAGFFYTAGTMAAQTPFKVYFCDSAPVVRELTENLSAAGLRVVKTFDLHAACATLTDNICPHHGTEPCDCQLVVLQVHGIRTAPVSLIVHSHRGRTDLQWDDAPGFPPDPEGRALILRALDGGENRRLEICREVFVDAG